MRRPCIHTTSWVRIAGRQVRGFQGRWPKHRTRRANFEPLEQRHLLTVFWDGGGDGTSWNDPANWDEDGFDGVPVAGDEVEINIAANVVLNVNPPALNSFTLDAAGATFSATNRTFTVDGPLDVKNGTVTSTDSTWAGTGTLTNDANFTARGNTTIFIDLIQNGNLDVETIGTPTNVLVSSGFTNNGTIILEDITGDSLNDVRLEVTNGTLVNSATGVITSRSDTTSASNDRKIEANVTNNGVINIEENTQFTKLNGTITNNNDFNIVVGKTFSYSGGNQVFNQDEGALNIAGELTMNGDSFNFNGGSLSGNPPILTSSALTLGPTSTGVGVFRMQREGALAGNIAQAQTVRIEAEAIASANVTAASGFTNNGTIILEDITGDSLNDVRLEVTNGTLVNSATGVITSRSDTTSASNDRQIEANVTNNGVINIEENTQFTKLNGTITNNNDFNIVVGKTFNYSGGNQVFNQDEGALNIAGELTMNGDSFNFNGGSITGGGSATFTNSNVAAAGTAAIDVDTTGASVELGASPGILNVVTDGGTGTGGNYTQSSTTDLNIEITGHEPGTGFDQLNVEGNAVLSGTLNVTFTSGFVPNPCEQFEIITYGSRSGTTPA